MKGRTAYHDIWEKYFTLPWNLKQVDKKNQTPIDDFLSEVNYSKSDKKLIKNKTKNCESTFDYTEELSKIFNFQLSDIIKAEKLAQIVISQKTSPNLKYANEYIFRGYIILSKMLSTLLEHDISQTEEPLLDNYSWNSIRYIYESLLIQSASQEIVDDFIKAIDPILTSYTQFSDKIMFLPNDNSIKLSFVYLAENLIQILSANSTFSFVKIVDFLNQIFSDWIQSIEKLEITDPFYNVYNLHYVQKILSITKKLNSQQNLIIANIISRFFSFYDKIDKNDYFISNGINNLQLLSEIVDKLDSDFHRHGLFEFILYSTTFYFDSNRISYQKRDYFSENEKSLSYFTPEEYFQTHQMIDLQKTNFQINMMYIKNIVSLFQSIISKSSFTNEIIFTIFTKSNNLNLEQLKKFYLVFISSISMMPKLNSKFISELFKVYSNNGLFSIPQDGLHQLVLDNTFSLLLNSIIKNDKICEILFFYLFEICSTKFESILIFMPILRSILKDNYDRKTAYFIIYLLKQDGFCNYIHMNMNNPNYQQQIDEIVSFIQVTALIYPADIFISGLMFPIFFGFVTKERYETISLSWIKYSFDSLTSVGSNSKLFENIILIISVILEKTKGGNESNYLIQLSNKIVQILSETVANFSIKVALMFSDWNLLMSFASLPQKTKEITTFKNVTSFLFHLDKQTNHKIEYLNTIDSMVFSCLKDSFNLFKLDIELIEILLTFSMSKKVGVNFEGHIPTIQNRFALKLLIDIAKDTEYEQLILDDLVQLCNQSTSNAFECFHIDIIKYTLERALKKELRVQAIQLYQIVSSIFFSPLSLYETFKALYCTSLNKRSNYHQMILDCFLRLILENRPNPVCRYFHFNGLKTGIIGPNIPGNLTQNWSFITTLRMDTSMSIEDPLLCLSNDSNLHYLFSFIDDELVFSYNSSKSISRNVSQPASRNDKNNSSQLPLSTVSSDFFISSKCQKISHLRKDSNYMIFPNFKFSKYVWYQILIVFTQRDILLFVNGSQVSSLKLKKVPQLNGNVMVKIANYNTFSFTGDLGPTFFIKNQSNGVSSENIEQIINEYQKSAESTFTRLHSILCYDPYNSSDVEISDVIPNEESAILIGSSVQFCSTLSSVIQHCGTFKCFLPLFSIVDHPCIDDSAEIWQICNVSSDSDDEKEIENETETETETENKNENDSLNRTKTNRKSSLTTSFGIINLADDDDDDDDNKNSTDNKSVDDQIFHTLLVILKMLLEISPEMERNFESIGGFQLLAGLFSPFTPESFTIYVPHDMEEIYCSLKSDTLKHQMVEYIWLNFDLWSTFSMQIQKRFFDFELKQAFLVDPKPFNFSTYDFLLYQIQSSLSHDKSLVRTNSNSLLLNNYENEEEVKEIKNSQWDFFTKLFKPNTATIWFLFFILSYNENSDIRNSAYKLFNNLLIEKNNVMLDSLIILSKIDNYLLILDKNDPSNFLRFVYLLGKLQKEDQNLLKIHFDFQKTILGSTELIDYENSNASQLFNDCSNYTFNNVGFNCTEFIPLLSILSTFSEEKDVKNVYSIFSVAIKNDFPSINKFTNEINGWPFYFFILSNNSENMTTLFTNFICRSPKKLKILIDFYIYIQLKMKINMTPPLINLMISILNQFSDYETVFLILNVILFHLKNDFENLKEFDKLTKEEIKTLRKSLESLSLLNLKVEFDPFFDDHLYEILEDIFLTQFPKQIFVFQSDFALGSFVIYSYLLSIRILKTRNFSLFKDYLIKKEEFINKSLISQNIIDMSQSFIDRVYLKLRDSIDFHNFNEDLKYEETINTKLNEKTVLDDYNYFIQKANDYSQIFDLNSFIDNITSISNGLKYCVQIVKEINPNANDAFHDAYKNTLHNYKHSRSIVEQYNIKLAQSFIRESTSNGGPLSTTPPESVKWRWTIRTDSLFRPSFYRVNLYFSNHSKAARIRDSMKLDSNTEKIIPFKRILDQKVSLSNSIQKVNSSSSLMSNSKAVVSFSVINMTISVRYFGRLSIIEDRIFFEGNAFSDGFGTPFKKSGNNGDKNAIYDEQSRKTKFIEFPLENLEFIFIRAFLYEDVACEIYTNLNKSYFFIFNSKENRNDFMNAVKRELDDKSPTQILKTVFTMRIKRSSSENVKDEKFDFFRACRKATGCHIQNITSQELVTKSGIVEVWQNRKISNFMYLFFLNIIAGRSLNDLSKYPVFPWVFCDYSSDTIDINNPDVYRKFDIPLGAYNSNRLELIKDFMQDTFDKTEFCLYRTHYSSAAFVIGYLVRTEPFATLHIILQGGMFDHSDRLFSSIENTWNSVSSQMNDFRELIPQFFCDPHFLINENGFDLGKKMNGMDVSNVTLPKWANNSAYKFIEIQRAGIESEYVSLNIHHWIDLIFGVYQKSYDKNNLYHMFSYPDCLQSPLITEEYQVQMAKYHGINFGTCCDQIFSQNHPTRNPLLSPIRKSPSLTKGDKPLRFSSKEVYYFDNQCILTKSGLLYILSPTFSMVNLQLQFKEKKFYSLISICQQQSLIFMVSRGGTFMSVISYKGQASEVSRVSHFGSSILCLEVVDSQYVLTGGSDCSIHIWSLPSMDLVARMSFQSRSVLTLSCCHEIDLVASIDENHQVWCSSIDHQRLVNTFQVECPIESSHLILVTKNGFIFVSNSCRYSKVKDDQNQHNSKINGLSENFCIQVFDTRGNVIKKINLNSSVVKMREVYLNYSVSFIVASLDNMNLIVIRTSDLEIVDTITSYKIVPELFSVDCSQKEILFICQSEDGDYLKSHPISSH